MGTLYYLNVSLHVLAAVFWLGGVFFLALIGAPVLRKVDPPSLRARLFRELGRRFRVVGWTLIAVLLVTGVLNMQLRGLLDPALLGSTTFWSSSYGRALMWKLIAVLAMLVLSAAHDFVLGPSASRLEAGSAEAERARRSASWLARLSALAGLAVVLAAVRLTRGG
jgi:copper resistance protein D